MRELVILSGKGGTGKTSFAAALASIAGPLVVADTDVDAPNLRLLLQADGKLQSAKTFLGAYEMSVDDSRCLGCGRCEDCCRFQAVTVEIGDSLQPLPRFDPLGCEGCGLCARICPNQAISVARREAGVVRVESTPWGPMVTGSLVAGEENSGQLVTLVRRTAQEVALSHGLNLILCDGPPGVGCPVIAAASHASFILLVTEPSGAALHDLERTADLAERFEIPAAVVLNKADLVAGFATRVSHCCRERGLDLLQSFPYSDAFFSAARRGISVVEGGDEGLRRQFQLLWDRLEARIPDLPILGTTHRDAVNVLNIT